jgi:flagellar hook protein FlgE
VSQIDGYESGELQDFTIGSDGLITGVYSNGQKEPLAMVALANFSNAAGLEKIGSNLYTTTANSGDFTGGVAAGSGGTGTLSSGTLEMSNVDLAQQFSEMMITQRAYQANSKIISTTDEMLETLVNLVR